jgi:hypothetical protein
MLNLLECWVVRSFQPARTAPLIAPMAALVITFRPISVPQPVTHPSRVLKYSHGAPGEPRGQPTPNVRLCAAKGKP